MSDATYIDYSTVEEAKRKLEVDVTNKVLHLIYTKAWEGDAPWVEFYYVIDRLEHGPEPETLVELGESAGVDRNEIYQAWNRLSKRERKEVMLDIKDAIASVGTVILMDELVDDISRLTSTINDIDERRRVLVDVLDKAYQFVDRKISFDELISYIANLLSPLKRNRDPESYKKAVALGKYLAHYSGKESLEFFVYDVFIKRLERKLGKYAGIHED